MNLGERIEISRIGGSQLDGLLGMAKARVKVPAAAGTQPRRRVVRPSAARKILAQFLQHAETALEKGRRLFLAAAPLQFRNEGDGEVRVAGRIQQGQLDLL